jgi:hypothetical protein
VKTMSKGNGTKAARAMGYDVGAIPSADFDCSSDNDNVVCEVSLPDTEDNSPQ